jgi:hypothetical protein
MNSLEASKTTSRRRVAYILGIFYLILPLIFDGLGEKQKVLTIIFYGFTFIICWNLFIDNEEYDRYALARLQAGAILGIISYAFIGAHDGITLKIIIPLLAQQLFTVYALLVLYGDFNLTKHRVANWFILPIASLLSIGAILEIPK